MWTMASDKLTSGASRRLSLVQVIPSLRVLVGLANFTLSVHLRLFWKRHLNTMQYEQVFALSLAKQGFLVFHFGGPVINSSQRGNL